MVYKMKEDILEQIAEDFFNNKKGFFTKHNIKFRPVYTDTDYDSKADSVHSDIDLIALSIQENSKLYAVSCKSWQGGYNATKSLDEIENAIKKQPGKTKGERDYWCLFRELCIKKWRDSFLRAIRLETNKQENEPIDLEYWILCTKITLRSVENKDKISSSQALLDFFKEKNVDLKIKVITIDELIDQIKKSIENKETPSVETTHFSRTLQLIIASGYKISKDK